MNDRQQPGKVLGMDFVGPMDQKYLLVKVDFMSRVVQLDVCSAANAKATIAGLKKWRKKFELMDKLVSDQGKHF